jgi:deoxyadenosine/deoxycytidine kinase
MTIYTIDGNIGCGKTSVLNYLHKYKNIQIDLEPVEKWKTFLDNIYLSKTGYFNFQIKVWLDRAWIQEKDSKSIILMERSPFFIRNTFNKNDYNNNNINEDEFNVINEMYNKTDNIWKSNLYIYLRSSPKKCLERIQYRGRNNEMDISLDYIINIHNLHEETYKIALDKKLNIIVIDINNKSINEIADEIFSLINDKK